MEPAWLVVLIPVAPEANARKNKAGVSVCLTDGDLEWANLIEVGRVAFIRRNSRNPETSFEDQLSAMIETAQKAAAEVNRLDAEYADEMARRREEARERVREMIGKPDAVPA